MDVLTMIPTAFGAVLAVIITAVGVSRVIAQAIARRRAGRRRP